MSSTKDTVFRLAHKELLKSKEQELKAIKADESLSKLDKDLEILKASQIIFILTEEIKKDRKLSSSEVSYAIAKAVELVETEEEVESTEVEAEEVKEKGFFKKKK